MLKQQAQRFVHYDEAHYQSTAYSMAGAGINTVLFEKIGFQEMLNHISTVFWAYVPEIGNVEIHVGWDNPVQLLMKKQGIKGIAGLTPKFPIQNPYASDIDNEVYVRAFRNKLDRFNIQYVEAEGHARDFQQGGDGCFLLVDVTKEQVKDLLGQTQLSFTFLPPEGVAELVSCIEEKRLPTNSLRECVRKMTFEERAIALAFLGTEVGGIDFPFGISPRVFEFMLTIRNGAVPLEHKLKLINFLSKLLMKPEILR